VELTEAEIDRCRDRPDLRALAEMYHGLFSECRRVFTEDHGLDLVDAFGELQDKGCLEILTCGATHGYLPLMEQFPSAVRAQIRVAVEHYDSVFGRAPRGIWLPECGFFPGVDRYLAEAGLSYTFTDTHGVLHAAPRPNYGIYAPITTRGGVSIFGRDIESSKQVWSANEGYPGDYWYRDFYRDYSYELDYDYVRPYLGEDGRRKMIGLKYYRITGKTDEKELYDPEMARGQAEAHAGNFMFNRERQVEYLFEVLGRKPIIVAPYDAELFGHWWFEGPLWLEHLLRKIDRLQDTVTTITPSEYLSSEGPFQTADASLSSWGYNGYNEVWVNGANDYIYPHLHRAAKRMTELAKEHPHAEGLRLRALNQAARELLLAQASDWAFIMKTGTMSQYAHKRVRDHIARFTKLYHDIKSFRIPENWLGEVEWRDRIFRDIDYRIYANDDPIPGATASGIVSASRGARRR
jgi:1,4-alpha-glucan branching enzyme